MTLENTILECFYRINLQRVKLPPHVRQQRLQGESSNIKLQNKLIRQYFHFEWLFFLRDNLKLSNSGIFNAEWWYIRSLTKINENTMGQISLHDGFKNKPNLSQFELFFYQFSKEAGFVWVQSTLTSISNKHFHLTHYREKLLKKTVTQKYQSNSIFGQFLRYPLSRIKFHIKTKLNLF